jgi:splicing factor 3A subunit 1
MGHEDAILNERPIGVIIPPPETKKIIDKAAELVARYGSSVEATLKNDEKNLPKFSFLNMNDHYRPYYDQKINELIKSNRNNNETKDFNKLLGRKTEATPLTGNLNPLNTQRNNSIQNELRKMIEEKRLAKASLNDLKPPSQDQFSISHPNISPLDMDIIKATAQFVARNGQRFLTGLSEREMKNPQFDFLKPQHNLFGYFTYLVESYAKCLRKEDINKLNTYASDTEFLIKKANERYLWEKLSKESQKKKDILDEAERNQMAQIEWNDFAIVEVIDFTEEELYDTVPVSGNIYINENINSIEGNINTMLGVQNINNITSSLNANFKFDNLPDIAPEINKKETTEIKITQIEEPSILPEPNMKIVKNYIRKQTTTETSKKETVK